MLDIGVATLITGLILMTIRVTILHIECVYSYIHWFDGYLGFFGVVFGLFSSFTISSLIAFRTVRGYLV